MNRSDIRIPLALGAAFVAFAAQAAVFDVSDFGAKGDGVAKDTAAVQRAIYDIGKLGKIAGSQMLDGKLVAKEKFRILRAKSQVWDGKVRTLRHFKDEVKEVSGQQECGVCFANYEGFQVGDTIECYSLEELPRSL